MKVIVRELAFLEAKMRLAFKKSFCTDPQYNVNFKSRLEELVPWFKLKLEVKNQSQIFMIKRRCYY